MTEPSAIPLLRTLGLTQLSLYGIGTILGAGIYVLVLHQRCIDGFSVPVVFRNKTQCADNGHSPCQALQRRCGTPQERPKGGSVSAHARVAPLTKDYGHSLRSTPRHER